MVCELARNVIVSRLSFCRQAFADNEVEFATGLAAD